MKEKFKSLITFTKNWILENSNGDNVLMNYIYISNFLYWVQKQLYVLFLPSLHAIIAI